MASGASARRFEAEILRLTHRRELLKLADRLPSRRVRLVITAVDLVSGREVVLSTGSLVEAVRASLPADVTLLVGFTRAAELIAAGEAAAEQALPDLLALQQRSSA